MRQIGFNISFKSCITHNVQLKSTTLYGHLFRKPCHPVTHTVFRTAKTAQSLYMGISAAMTTIKSLRHATVIYIWLTERGGDDTCKHAPSLAARLQAR